MSWITQALSLLQVDTSSIQASSAGSGGRSSGGGSASKYRDFVNKDMAGNSSIATKNRLTLAQQLHERRMEQARDLFEEDIRKAHENDREKDSELIWKDAWDKLTPEQKSRYLLEYEKEGKITNPALSSQEASRQAAGQEMARKDAAREAMRDYVKGLEAQAKRDGERWTHDDAERARQMYRNEELLFSDEIEDESTPQTQNKLGPDGSPTEMANPEEASKDTDYATQSDLDDLRNDFENHRGDGDTHYG